MSSVSAVNSLLSGSSTSSTSSINLSSLLQTATGASSVGIDVSAAVQAAIYADRAPERQWQAQQATITSKITALSSIQTALTSLTTNLDQLGDVSGSLASRTVASSSYFVSATASAGAAIGQHTIAVQSLASAASWYSPVMAGGSTLSAGTVTLTMASGTQASFATGAGVSSLSDLASAINASSVGVKASVVADASGSRLALVSASSGAASDFTATYVGSSGATDPGFSFTRAGAGANASLTVDGIPISSTSNVVTGAISGVTLSLTGTTATGSPASIQVAADSSAVTQALSSFVTDYNAALSQVSSQFKYSASSSSQGPLSGNSDIRTLQNTLLAITGYNPGGGSSTSSVKSLTDIGITVGDDGSLSLDTTKLASAVADPSDLQKFFRGDATNGFAPSFKHQLAAYGNVATGSIAGEISNLNQQYTALGKQQTDYESGYIASQTTLLTAMYSKAEIALQQLPSQMQQIQAELGNDASGKNG